ncbi:TetR family transcriptional regulator [Sphingomonas sp. BHC-A]|uniref:TetR family transcriptional regulator n=1 Tax=Sphingobium indicum F2 TaxID=1450518 RepID=A0A8E0WQY6_9SPHN|nr:TetR/AcrR family transcriptional regulator [Sphingobium indicum]KER35702.1 TetR family transcriptional regulator [Sphingobium indicum F2]KEY99642.1 TetR family transcriptional regulator [Sphingomonas sp. BHC-A]
MTKSLPPLSRREARRRDRRKAILDVASRSFMENGYAATTMSSIAATLGGSKGTLWSYFPCKEALFAAVLDDATTAYRARLAEILDPEGDLAGTLRTLGLNLLTKITSPESIALYRLVASESGRFPEMGAIFYQYAPGSTRRLIAEFLERAMDRGLLRRADPELAARTFAVLMLSGCHQSLVWGQIERATAEQIEADVEHGLDCFLRAYAPPAR